MAVSPHVEKMLTLPYPEAIEFLGRAAEPGSPVNQQMVQALAVRLVGDTISAVGSGSTRIANATASLSSVIESAAEASNTTNEKLMTLNKRLYWVTVVMLALTIVLVVFGGLQLVFMQSG